MFFLSAHKVVSSQHGEGVNVYYYRKDADAPSKADGTLDVIGAHDNPGELIHLDATIKPGGNRVTALLDFVSANQLELHEVVVFFEETQKTLKKTRPPLVYANRAYGIHFNTDLGLYSQRQLIFAELGQAILRIVEHPPARSLRDQKPLVVLVEKLDDSVAFTLDEESSQRIRKLKGNTWKVPVVRAQTGTLEDFASFDGNWLRRIGEVMTELDAHEILKLGGIRFVVDDSTKKILWQWPSAKKGTPEPR